MSIRPQDSINGNAKAQVQMPPEMKPTEAIVSAAAVCPFIGLEDDPSTRLLFVSPSACCHRAEPVHAVDLSHQQAYCLMAAHKLCPVFMRPEWGPLPADIAYHETRSASPKNRWFWRVAALVVLLLIGGGLFLWGNGRSSAAVGSETGDKVPVVLVVSTSTVTATPTFVESATPTPTKTAVPEPTLTPSAIPTMLPSATPTTQPTAVPSATLVPTYTPVPPTQTTIPPTKTAVPPVKSVVTVPLLNVRSGPSVDYDVVGTIAAGEIIELTGRLANASWWQICCVLGQTGWVIGEAVELPANAESLVPVIQNIPRPPTPQLEP